MERTRECGLVLVAGRIAWMGDKGCEETGAGPDGGNLGFVGGDIFMTVPLVRINHVASWLGTRAADDIFSG